MFKNLLQKFAPEKVEQEIMIAEKPVIKNYPSIVEEIHNEFDTASDKCLIAAYDFLQEAKEKDFTKVSRLKSVGFVQSNQVVSHEPIIKQTELSKEQIKIISYYRQKYPLYKFITESDVELICGKYNLVCGEIKLYTGFVPESNLKDVERFKIDESDKQKLKVSISTYGDSKGQIIYDNGDAAKQYPNIRKEGSIKKSLMICAPKKDMDIRGYDIRNGYQLVQHIPDPVVLQPVNGGYLIVTKWGDEASDPLLTNPIEN